MKFTDLSSIDPIYAVAAVIAAGFMVVNGPASIQKMNADRAATSALVDANQTVERQAKIDTASAERQNLIAVARYKAGCQMVFAHTGASFVALQEGVPVNDRITQRSVPDGGTYCDQIGNTGVMRKGAITSLAFSTDRSVIAQAVKRYTTAQSVPKLNSSGQ